MNENTIKILNTIQELKTQNNRVMIESMKDYWQGFNDGVNTLLTVANELKTRMIDPVQKALKEEKTNESSI